MPLQPPNVPCHPYTPCWPLSPYWPLTPYTHAGPQCPYTPASPNAPDALNPLLAPDAPTPPADPWHPLPPEQEFSCQEWYYYRWAWHVTSLWVRLLFCQKYCQPLMPPQCSLRRGTWWPRVVLTEVLLTRAHFLLSAIDHLVCYCHQFAIDHFHKYIQLTIYHL